MIFIQLLVILSCLVQLVLGHGYLKSPRSRNHYANVEGVDWTGSPGQPLKEYCQHCLNRKAATQVCGIGAQNYDNWTDSSGNRMPWISQATYTEGQEIVIEVVITANHAGHFDVFVCPDGDTSTQECFLDHPLTFVEDMLHGGPVDDHYPSRAYISPNAKFFKLKYRLPEGIQGDQAMLQWRYVTANSCTPPGYDREELGLGTRGWLPYNGGECAWPPNSTGEPGPSSGEQFWNCAEISILPAAPTAPTPPVQPPVQAPSPPVTLTTRSPTTIKEDDSRLIAYLGNWQSCPTTAEVAKYTHIVIAFAVSYTWSPSKNICSVTCEIAEPPICSNSANPALVSKWQAAGQKVILSFGGAGMGGSWAGDNNDCWEYCYGREEQVVDRLVEIVDKMGLDGVDLDFEYHVTSPAITFLNEVTIGLRNKLPVGSEITHAPMDPDVMPEQPYYESVLKVTGQYLDFLMPQYYNGYTRPAIDGISGTGAGNVSALSHYNSIVNNIFGGDSKRMVFGFCISDCSSTGSNASAQQASQIMTDLALEHPCNGGAFFWVAEHDQNTSWSSVVGTTIENLAATNCHVSPTLPPQPTASPSSNPTAAPVLGTDGPTKYPTSHPTAAPVPGTVAPTKSPTKSGPNGDRCCPQNYYGLRAWNHCLSYYHCVNGEVFGDLINVPTGTLFDQSIQNFNWAAQVTCAVDNCGGDPVTPLPTASPVSAPIGGGNPCCPSGYTGLKAWNNCHQFYHCVNGVVVGEPISGSAGTLFDQNIQNFNWADQVTCFVDNCGRRLRG